MAKSFEEDAFRSDVVNAIQNEYKECGLEDLESCNKPSRNDVNRKVKNARKVIFDGIEFNSDLEMRFTSC